MLSKLVLHGDKEVGRIRAIVDSKVEPRKVDAILTYKQMAFDGVIPLMLAIGRSRSSYLAIYLHAFFMFIFLS